MDAREAFEDLDARPGSQIVTVDHARTVAAAFGVTLRERPGELQPIKEMDRLQPDNDALGIGVGSLVKALAHQLDLDPETGHSIGHGRYQRELKEANLPKLTEAV